MLGVSGDLDRPAVLDGDEQCTGIGAIVGAGGADDAGGHGGIGRQITSVGRPVWAMKYGAGQRQGESNASSMFRHVTVAQRPRQNIPNREKLFGSDCIRL
jgi:hypothetical protein